MRTAKVIVVPYTAEWKSDFEKIRKELESALKGMILGIEHVGSTSVEGLRAKPVIDIDVIIRDNSMLSRVIQRLGSIGYIHEGNLGIPGREAFKYYNKPHLQKHHLYVCLRNSAELHRHITFRNFLRNNPEAVKKYGEVKKQAAQLYPDSIEKYMEYKSACIEELYKICGLE